MVLALAFLVAGLALSRFARVDRAAFAPPRDAVTYTDRHGTPMRHARQEGEDRRWVRLEEVSPHLLDALVAVEDQRFYEHGGADGWALGRASASLVWPGRRPSGGSTITQQLVKLVHGRPNGLADKPLEIARALALERDFDKRWILEQYVNRLPFGNGIVGVARASEVYFGKPVGELSVAEASLLAGIPQAPSATEPRRHLRRALRRRRFVLARMRETWRIDEATYRRALEETPRLAPDTTRPWRAPRFVDAAERALAEGRLLRSGGRVRTSLDLELQTEAERLLEAQVARFETRGGRNGAAVVVANQTGEILAYVGAARSGADAPAGQMDLLRARRQPGSTLKPFAYQLFFERGGTPASLLDDISTPMVGGDGTLFAARDYDGRERGPVRARPALASSLNLAALDVARRVGAHDLVERLRALGFAGVGQAEDHGAAIVLGGVDITALELAQAYAALAEGGVAHPLSFGGAPEEGRELLQPGSSALVRDILEDRRARREGFGDDLAMRFGPGRFGLKTGTSSGWRDAWTAAFTDEVTVVVWLGDPSGAPMAGVSGFEGAAPVAVELLAFADERARALGLSREHDPPELATLEVCAASGLALGSRCTRSVRERFSPDGVMPHRCEAHAEGGALRLPARYRSWIESTRPAAYALGADAFALPSGAEGSAEEGPLVVAHPRDGTRWALPIGHRDSVPLRARVGLADVSARWEVDGRPLAGERWVPSPGDHELVALVGARRSEVVHVRVDPP